MAFTRRGFVVPVPGDPYNPVNPDGSGNDDLSALAASIADDQDNQDAQTLDMLNSRWTIGAPAGLSLAQWDPATGRITEFAYDEQGLLITPVLERQASRMHFPTTRVAHHMLSASGGAVYETISDASIRIPFMLAANVYRWRLRISNKNERAALGGALAGAVSFTGVWIARTGRDSSGNIDGTLVNPAQAVTAFTTAASGAAYYTPWVTTSPNGTTGLRPGVDYTISFGYTNTAGQNNIRGYAGCWRSADHTAAAATSAAGYVQDPRCPFDIAIECEIPETTPVELIVGDSMAFGIGSTYPARSGWPHVRGRTTGIWPLQLTYPGASWSDITAASYGRLAGMTADRALLEMGKNDELTGQTGAQMQASMIAHLPDLRSVTGNILVMSVPPSTAAASDATKDAQRQAYNAFLAGIPQGATQFVDASAALTDPATGRIKTALVTADGTHPTTAGHAVWAAAINQVAPSLAPARSH